MPFNFELSSNQFVSCPSETTIDFNGGNLNLQVNAVDLEQKPEVILSILNNKYNNDLNILTDQPNVKLNSKSTIKGSLNICLPEIVDSLLIKEVTLSESAINAYFRSSSNSNNRSDGVFKTKRISIKTNNVTLEKSQTFSICQNQWSFKCSSRINHQTFYQCID